jgi:hypothetical protein
MLTLLSLLSIVTGIGSLVCLILVLTKLFPEKGIVWGIFGIICGIYTFIWGWQNAERLGIQQTMQLWTGFVIASVIINVLVSAMF